MRALKESLNKFFAGPKKRRPDTDSGIRAKAKRLAQANGIRLEQLSKAAGDLNVWPPDHYFGTDPYEGDHYAGSWNVALERVERYVANLSAMRCYHRVTPLHPSVADAYTIRREWDGQFRWERPAGTFSPCFATLAECEKAALRHLRSLPFDGPR